MAGDARCVTVLLVVSALMIGSLDATASRRSQTGDLDDMLGTSPMDSMIEKINAGVEHDVDQEMRGAGAKSLPETSLDAAIDKIAVVRGHKHKELGEGNSVTEMSSSKAAAMQALHEAEKAFAKSQPGLRPHAKSGGKGGKGTPVQPAMRATPTAELRKEVNAAKQLPQTAAKPQSAQPSMTADDDSDDILNKDPIDEMDSLISSEVHEAIVTNTAPRAEDPLDMAIDKINVVRKQEKTKDQVKKSLRAARRSMDLAENAASVELLEESEKAPGDPGETIPAPTKAAGPPNPPVKEVIKMVPAQIPMGRSTPEVKGSLDAALSKEKATEKAKEATEPSTGPAEAAPPPPDSLFSQKEIESERKHIEAYPVPKDEAIAEAVSKLVPWDNRIDPKKDVSKGPPAIEKKVNITETANATETNSTANATAVETFELEGM